MLIKVYCIIKKWEFIKYDEAFFKYKNIKVPISLTTEWWCHLDACSIWKTPPYKHGGREWRRPVTAQYYWNDPLTSWTPPERFSETLRCPQTTLRTVLHHWHNSCIYSIWDDCANSVNYHSLLFPEWTTLYKGLKKKVEFHKLLCGPELELLVVKKKENSHHQQQRKSDGC